MGEEERRKDDVCVRRELLFYNLKRLSGREEGEKVLTRRK